MSARENRANTPTRRGARMPVLISCAVAVMLALGLSACTKAPTAPASPSASEPSDSSVPTSVSARANTSSTATPSASSAATSTASASSASTSSTVATVGALAEGFPSAAVPVFDGATVKQSAFERGTDHARVSLVLTTSKPADAAMDFYSKTFTDAGFKQLPGDAVGSVKSRVFIRHDGDENANVSAITHNGTTTITIAVTLAPGAVK